jgi:hypothetical protein
LPKLALHRGEFWLEKLKKLDFRIANAKRERERRKLYRDFLGTATKLAWHLGGEALRLHPRTITAKASLSPFRRSQLDQRWDGMLQDLLDVCGIHRQCEARVLNGKKAKGSDRLLSLADRTAAFIVKGGRTPVVGYKTQLARSANGLVTGLLVPEGNASDSAMCLPLAEQVVALTGVVPALASFDDGYTSARNLLKLKKMGIAEVSFSGSKGKRLLGDDLWDAEPLREARRLRSRVECLIFCLKHSHEFGEVRRRGIEQVRDELLGKAVVYNFARIIMLRKRRRQSQADAVPEAA